MRFFHSQNNFLQHRPHQNWWQRLKKLRQRRTLNAPRRGPPALYNPYHEKEKQPSHLRRKALWTMISLLLVAWLGLLLYLPYFRITDLSYSGLNNIRPNNLSNFILQHWWQQSRLLLSDNYFFVSTNRLAELLREQFKLKAVSIAKIFPNQLKIQVVEKNTTIIYFNGAQYFLLDTDGEIVIEQPIRLTSTSVSQALATSTTGIAALVVTPTTSIANVSQNPNLAWARQKLGNYPLLFDKRKLNPNDGPVDKIIIRVVIDWDDILRKQGIAKVNYYILEDVPAGLRIITNKPWQLLAGLENIADQANNLKTILQTVKPVEYIDLRFGERIYWR